MTPDIVRPSRRGSPPDPRRICSTVRQPALPQSLGVLRPGTHPALPLTPTLSKYSVKELSPRTRPGFEKLFLRKSKGGGCWCMIFHQLGRLPKSEKGGMTRSRVAKSRRDKRTRVESGTSHGVLVYADAEPVGWCQYGPKEELPRIDAGTTYRKLALADRGQKLCRITCFWVDREHRNEGVATTASAAVLESIRKKGGGLVEAYPSKVKGFPADWTGTWPMFRKQGFEIAALFGKYNVLVRRVV